MGLSMKERDSVTKEIANRYKNARKKEKKTILNEYISLTGFNRKYAISVNCKKYCPKNSILMKFHCTSD